MGDSNPVLEVGYPWRPEVREVELRLVEHFQEVRNQEREAELEEHHGAGPDELVAVVAVLHEHPHAEEEDRERVEEAVEKPVVGRASGQGDSQGCWTSSEGRRVSIDGHSCPVRIRAGVMPGK